MKKGFTLLELLVASLLLSMLVTILTQLFSQSSIAWRTGESGVSDLDKMRASISANQRDADNALPGSGNRRLVSLWDKNGELRTKAWSDTEWDAGDRVKSKVTSPSSWSRVEVLNEDSASTRIKNYTVGVTSAGPDREFQTWDDVTSYPAD